LIKVLQDWRELGGCVLSLTRQGLSLHETVQKNWDHFLLWNMVDRRSPIVDLGCGRGFTLRFLSALGFSELLGVDFRIEWALRARQLANMWRRRTLHPPYALRAGSILATRLPSAHYSMAVSISMIEHGVDLDAFLAEVSRLLKVHGRLFVTTDYWQEKIGTLGCNEAFGLPWRIFCSSEIPQLVESAGAHGLTLIERSDVPECSERTVCWENRDYTFIALAFEKTSLVRQSC
jgi:SAM-dependent methyltransferase